MSVFFAKLTSFAKPRDWKMSPSRRAPITTKHGHTTDHMLVAMSDYELTDRVKGKGIVVRTRKSGEVDYIPAGITHRITNTAKYPHASTSSCGAEDVVTTPRLQRGTSTQTADWVGTFTQ